MGDKDEVENDSDSEAVALIEADEQSLSYQKCCTNDTYPMLMLLLLLLGTLASGIWVAKNRAGGGNFALYPSEDPSSTTTGRLFQLDRTREYPTPVLRFSDSQTMYAQWRALALEKGVPTSAGATATLTSCPRWSIVTTKLPPSYLIHQLSLHSSEWCLVVVAGEMGPVESDYNAIAARMSPHRFVFLNPEVQSQLPFVSIHLLPYNHLGRKNIGYLYAMAHGARVIYDTDIHNRLLYEGIPFDEHLNARLHEHQNESSMIATRPDHYLLREDAEECVKPPHGGCILSPSPGWFPRQGLFVPLIDASTGLQLQNTTVLNPLPWYSTWTKSDVHESNLRWPRGFPINRITDSASWEPAFSSTQLGHGFDRFGDVTRSMPVNPLSRIGVVQSLAQRDPDFDALSHLSQTLPFRFNVTRGMLLIPPSVYSPYNAQATLHLSLTFWALLLPVSVDGRVSDIYRAYIAQRLMRDIGVSLAFSDAWVIQIRDSNEYLQDFDKEQHLYQRVPALLQLLDEWRAPVDAGEMRGSTGAFATAMVDLYRTLFSYGFIEAVDVELVESWWLDLYHIGYELHTELAQDDVAVAAAGDITFLESLNTTTLLGPVVGTDSSPESWPLLPPLARAIQPLNGWTHDNHQATMCDTFTTLSALGHTAYCASNKQRNMGAAIDLNNYSRIHYVSDDDAIAPYIREHSHAGVQVNEDQVVSLFDYYKAKPVFEEVDFVWCSFIPSTCEQYMAFNKSILWLAAHRFAMSRCRDGEFARIIEHVQWLAEARIKNPSAAVNVIAAQSVYDAAYIKYYTGVNPMVIEAHGLFYAYRSTRRPWVPTATPELRIQRRLEILVGPLTLSPSYGTGYHLIVDIRAAGAVVRARVPGMEEYQFDTAKVLYGWFNFQQVANHRAIVLLPYAVMSLGIIDLYAIGIPMFVPSVDLLYSLGIVDDRVLSEGGPYCHDPASRESALPPQHETSHFPYSPDSRGNSTAVRYWLQLADYYTLPHIVTFDSFEDLHGKLHRANFHAIHLAMMAHNERRHGRVGRSWQSVTANFQKHRQVPQGSFQDAMKDLWNTNRMMVY